MTEYYSCNADEEILYYTDPEEAIESHIDCIWNDDSPGNIPSEINVFVWNPVDINDKYIGKLAIDAILMHLDEEYGEPDENTEYHLNEKEQELLSNLCESIAENFPVWNHEIVCEEKYQIFFLDDGNGGYAVKIQKSKQ